MSKYGLTEERYAQMFNYYENDEDIEEIVGDWGPDLCNKGWGIFDFDCTGMLEIEAIADVNAYDDEEAVELAVKEGIKIIPVEELPENFDRRYFGWIDTPENRKKIEEYCLDLKEKQKRFKKIP